MFRQTRLVLLGLFLSSLAWAVEPVPGKTATKDPSKDVMGAIKVEDKPAVQLDEANPASPAETPAPAQASPVETTPATPPAAPAPAEKSGGSHHFGFHGQVGLPHPVNYGLNYLHPSEMFSLELSTGSTSIKVDGVEVTMKNTDLGLRWHPFLGSFYLGALVGNRTLTGKKTETISSVPISVTVDIKSNYLTPVLGWMWGISGGGFFLGTEFGYQSPSGVSTSLSTNADGTVQSTTEYRNLEKDVKDAGNKIGEIGLPHFVLLKLGWLF